MSNYDTKFSFVLNPGEENLLAAVKLAKDMTNDDNVERFKLDQPLSAKIELSINGLWIHDDGSSDLDGAIAFIEECRAHFDLKGRFAFEFANTCSTPKLDSYGGGAILFNFDAGTMESINSRGILQNFLDNKAKAAS